jgi:hypothetical protein
MLFWPPLEPDLGDANTLDQFHKLYTHFFKLCVYSYQVTNNISNKCAQRILFDLIGNCHSSLSNDGLSFPRVTVVDHIAKAKTKYRSKAKTDRKKAST